MTDDNVDPEVLAQLFRAYKGRHLATENRDGSLSLIVGVARRLEDIHPKLLGAPEDLLNVGRIVGRIGAALFLPALTTLISLTLQRSLFR